MQTGDDAPITPTSRQGFNHEFDDDHHHHHLQRRSVLAKVKDKAKRWRQRLAKKKHSRSGGDPTPAWGVSLDEEDDDDEWDEKEYRGAPPSASHLPSPPVYQSEMAPDTYRHTISPQQETTQSTTTDEHKESGWNPFDDDAADDINEKAAPTTAAGDTQPEAPPIERSSSISRLAGAVSAVIMAPAYMVSGATQMIVSKIHGSPGAATADEAGAKEAWDDNGVSVKDYPKDKLEPGDGEKALSEVITEAISPRKAAQYQSEVLSSSEVTTAAAQAARHQVEEISVVEKVRGAVFSLIWRKEQIPVQVDLPVPPKSSCE